MRRVKEDEEKVGEGGEETEKDGGAGKEEEVKISWSRSVEERGREVLSLT
jgi:hypothetical protein